MKRILSALAVILAAVPAIAAQPSAPPAPPSATHTGTVGLYMGNVWLAWNHPDYPLVSLADVQTFQKGNGYNGNVLAASFTANQISFDSRFSNFPNPANDGWTPSFRLPQFLESPYGGSGTGMIAVSSNDQAVANMHWPDRNCIASPGTTFNRLNNYNDPLHCVVWIEAKGTISLGPYDTLFIAHDGGVMLRASQADPVTDTGAWVAPFRAATAGGIICEQAAFGRSTGSYNVDLLYAWSGDSSDGNNFPGTPAVLALMVVPQGSPMPTCQ